MPLSWQSSCNFVEGVGPYCYEAPGSRCVGGQVAITSSKLASTTPDSWCFANLRAAAVMMALQASGAMQDVLHGQVRERQLALHQQRLVHQLKENHVQSERDLRLSIALSMLWTFPSSSPPLSNSLDPSKLSLAPSLWKPMMLRDFYSSRMVLGFLALLCTRPALLTHQRVSTTLLPFLPPPPPPPACSGDSARSASLY